MVAIFVVLTILLLVGVDVLLERRRQPREAAQLAPQPGAHLVPEPALPAGLFIHPGHTWAEILRSGSVRVGLDDFVRHALGRPDHLILRQPGEQVRQGDPLLTLERNGRQFVLKAPLSGTIESSNQTLAAHPESLERSAYGENWTYTLRPDRLGEEIGLLQVAERASRWLDAELRRLADWVGSLAPAQPGVAMQDGGLPVSGILTQLDETACRDFQQQFLDS